VSPNPIPNPIPEENKSFHLPARTCKLMHMTGSKMYSPVGKKPSPVWGSIYNQRKIPLHLLTIGFQKPGICADSWFLESNGKKVQWDYSLIRNDLFSFHINVLHISQVVS
jgi:hypothetical protein